MNNQIEEYKTLREEIGRHQEQVSRVLEFGILASSGVLSISFTDFVSGDYRWIVLLSPSLFLIPFIYLVVHLVNTTWFIGRYIENCLEPKLELQWEKINRQLRGDRNSPLRSRFAESSVLPLMIIQITCPIIAFLVGSNSIVLWESLTSAIFLIVIVEFVILRWFVPSRRWMKIVDDVFSEQP